MNNGQDPASPLAHGRLPWIPGRGSPTGMAASRSSSGRFRGEQGLHPCALATQSAGKADFETCLRSTRNFHRASASRSGGRLAGRCQRKVRLAYPCGVGPAAHHPGEDAVRRRRTFRPPIPSTLWTRRPSICAVGLSVGALPHHQGGVKMHTVLDLTGQHSEFYPHLGWQAASTFMPSIGSSRKPERQLRRGSWLRRLCPPLCVAASRGLLRHACQVEHRCSSRLFGADGSLDRISCATSHRPLTASTPSGLPRTVPHPLQGPRVGGRDAGLRSPHNFSLPAATDLRATKALAGGTLLQVDQAASSDRTWLLRHRRRTRSTDLDCRSVYELVAFVKTRSYLYASLLHFVTDPLGDPARENAHTIKHLRERKRCNARK